MIITITLLDVEVYCEVQSFSEPLGLSPGLKPELFGAAGTVRQCVFRIRNMGVDQYQSGWW